MLSTRNTRGIRYWNNFPWLDDKQLQVPQINSLFCAIGIGTLAFRVAEDSLADLVAFSIITSVRGTLSPDYTNLQALQQSHQCVLRRCPCLYPYLYSPGSNGRARGSGSEIGFHMTLRNVFYGRNHLTYI